MGGSHRTHAGFLHTRFKLQLDLYDTPINFLTTRTSGYRGDLRHTPKYGKSGAAACRKRQSTAASRRPPVPNDKGREHLDTRVPKAHDAMRYSSVPQYEMRHAVANVRLVVLVASPTLVLTRTSQRRTHFKLGRQPAIVERKLVRSRASTEGHQVEGPSP